MNARPPWAALRFVLGHSQHGAAAVHSSLCLAPAAPLPKRATMDHRSKGPPLSGSIGGSSEPALQKPPPLLPCSCQLILFFFQCLQAEQSRCWRWRRAARPAEGWAAAASRLRRRLFTAAGPSSCRRPNGRQRAARCSTACMPRPRSSAPQALTSQARHHALFHRWEASGLPAGPCLIHRTRYVMSAQLLTPPDILSLLRCRGSTHQRAASAVPVCLAGTVEQAAPRTGSATALPRRCHLHPAARLLPGSAVAAGEAAGAGRAGAAAAAQQRQRSIVPPRLRSAHFSRGPSGRHAQPGQHLLPQRSAAGLPVKPTQKANVVGPVCVFNMTVRLAVSTRLQHSSPALPAPNQCTAAGAAEPALVCGRPAARAATAGGGGPAAQLRGGVCSSAGVRGSEGCPHGPVRGANPAAAPAGANAGWQLPTAAPHLAALPGLLGRVKSKVWVLKRPSLCAVVAPPAPRSHIKPSSLKRALDASSAAFRGTLQQVGRAAHSLSCCGRARMRSREKKVARRRTLPASHLRGARYKAIAHSTCWPLLPAGRPVAGCWQAGRLPLAGCGYHPPHPSSRRPCRPPPLQDAHELFVSLLEGVQREVLAREVARLGRSRVRASETVDPGARSFGFAVRPRRAARR